MIHPNELNAVRQALLEATSVRAVFQVSLLEIPDDWFLFRSQSQSAFQLASCTWKNIDLTKLVQSLQHTSFQFNRASAAIKLGQDGQDAKYRMSFFWERRKNVPRPNFRDAPDASDILHKKCCACRYDVRVYLDPEDVGFYCKPA